jgi:hypothetical protein
MKISLVICVFVLLTLGCSETSSNERRERDSVVVIGEKNKNESDTKKSIVKELYNEVEKIKLPFFWENTSNKLSISIRESKSIKELSNKLFGIKFKNRAPIGVFDDTSNVYIFLFSEPADDIIPHLVTINKLGEKVDENFPGYQCGFDCGFYCEGATFEMTKGLDYISTHKSYSCDCTDEGNYDTSKVVYTVLQKRGSVSKEGKIVEGKESTVLKKEMPFFSEENPLLESYKKY